MVLFSKPVKNATGNLKMKKKLKFQSCLKETSLYNILYILSVVSVCTLKKTIDLQIKYIQNKVFLIYLISLLDVKTFFEIFKIQLSDNQSFVLSNVRV